MTNHTQEQPAHAERMRDHWWWRPGWRAGRRFYTWHITFGDDTDLHELVKKYQAALDMSGVDLIPSEWLHLTMQGVGFTDEVDETDVKQIVQAARQRCADLAPFEVTFERPLVEPEAIMFRVTPAEPVRRLRAAIREAIADVWGADNVPEAEGFAPHVSLAYSNADGPAQPFIDALGGVRAEPVTVTVRAAQLIVLNRDERMYRWTTYATVPLGGN